MKLNKFLKAFILTLSLGFVFTSCEPETYELGDTLEANEISYDIIQDFSVDAGGNTIVMTNNTPETIITWDYGTGRSNKAVETIQYAFKGDYTIKVSAVTEGGIVYLDPITVTVTEDNLSYVDDPLWTALSGGVGNSKTWVLDLDAEGNSKYFGGPMFFYGTDNAWLEGGDAGCYGDDCWNWSPDWVGNTWIAAQGNYGEMTFSLDGGPFLTTNHLMIPGYGQESGTYFLDADAKTLTTTDATILHSNENDACVDNWGDMKIFSLTEDTMQLGVLRKDDCDGAATLVFNFITKEYSDNWVPQDLPDPDPAIDLAGGTVTDLLSVTTATTKTWHLSADSPFDWTDLDGNLLNGWQTVADYEAAGWTGYVASDQDNVIKNKISFSNDGTVTTIDSNGNEQAGTYETEEGTNIITFSDISPAFSIGSSWAAVSTTAENQWKIIKTKATGDLVTDIWFGSRDAIKDEYMAFHFVLDNAIADDETEDQSTEIAFDNSKLVFGDIEDNGNLRLELYNEYGSTNGNSPIDTSLLVFSEKVEVTFTLSGITLNSGAVESYDTSIYYADPDWYPAGNGDIITVTGNGTYTVTYSPGDAVDGGLVFVVDIVGISTDITDLTAVSATIDSVVIH